MKVSLFRSCGVNWVVDNCSFISSIYFIFKFLTLPRKLKIMELAKDEIIRTLKCADAVCMDVDSTVCPDEGIDELAKFHGVEEKVKNLTKQAMGGTMTFQEALKARVEIINPSYLRLKSFLESRTPAVTSGVLEFVNLLRERGCHVYLVSGGFTEIISPVAEILKIPSEDIFANKFLYYYTGECVGVDKNSPTCRSGGKANVVRMLKEKHDYKNVIMIGDGATDLEACPPADAFIGFGGNVVRPTVQEKSNWFAYSFQEIIDAIKN